MIQKTELARVNSADFHSARKPSRGFKTADARESFIMEVVNRKAHVSI